MRDFLARRPSPAMAVAFVALLAALSGTAIALPGTNTVDSGDIKNNAVRSKDIRNNNIRSGDVRDGTLTGTDVLDDSVTGADINEGTLGTVPSATTANSANTANTASPTGPAGGDLTGDYPNPTIADSAVNSAKVADNSLTGADLAPDSVSSSELGPNSVNQSELVGLHIHSSAATNVPAGTDANGFFNSDTATATCAAGEDLFSWSVRWTTLGGSEEVSTMNVAPDFAAASVTVRAGTDEATDESFVVDAWCT